MRPSVPSAVGGVAVAGIVVAVGLGSAPRVGPPRWLPGAGPLLPSSVARAPSASALPSPPPAPPSEGRAPLDLHPVAIVLLALAVLVLAALVARWLLAHRRERVRVVPLAATGDEVVAVDEPEPEPDVPRRAFDDALDALASERVPRDAIVRAWLSLQDTAADSGVRRRAAETPTEFTARVLARVAADRDAMASLLDTYQQVRFGDREPGAEDRERVRVALGRLADSWDEGRRQAAVAAAGTWERRS